MKISVKLEVSQNSTSISITLDDLCLSIKQWNELSDIEKQEEIKKYVYDMHDQPYWMLDSFVEKF